MRLRTHLLDPSGGLGYHVAAVRHRRLWLPFVLQVADWLEAWRPPAERLVLVGPSAGYTLNARFLARFRQIAVLEPDPLARWLLRRRYPDAPFHFGRLDALAPGGPAALAAGYPGHALLFCNLLGQCGPEALPRLRRELPIALAAQPWASWHDVLSAAQPPQRLPAPGRQFGDAITLARHVWAGLPVQVLDHDTLGLAGPGRGYACWRLAPRAWQLIEWGWQGGTAPPGTT